MELGIDGEGAGRSQKLELDTVPDREVGKCVLSYVEKMKFPAPEDGGPVTFEFTLTFAPR